MNEGEKRKRKENIKFRIEMAIGRVRLSSASGHQIRVIFGFGLKSGQIEFGSG